MTNEIKRIVQWLRIIGTTKDGCVIYAPITEKAVGARWTCIQRIVVPAADLLEKLACERDQWKARCEAAERDINNVLHGGLICSMCNRVIIGAETGNRKGKVIPKREWVENILNAARITRMKVFMKESLRDLMGSDFRQEFPWEV